MNQPLYSIGTWDIEAQAYTPQIEVPAFNLTLWELKRSMKMLRECGYSCHRYDEFDNDAWVLVERTDGKSETEIMDQWKR